MRRIGMLITLVGAACWTPAANAVTAISRFDTGLDGWTVEGPGQLDWVAGPFGGHIQVTRVGPGEVYLVAPSSFHQSNCIYGYPTTSFTVTTDRAGSRPIQVEVQSLQPPTISVLNVPCVGCAFPWNKRAFGPANEVTGLRIRVGVDAALPLGEVVIFDNIEFRTNAGNCDGSTAVPILNANDFICFFNEFAARYPYANLDGSSVMPAINANDFNTFLGVYAAEGGGCP